jgi:hypothetical protein
VEQTQQLLQKWDDRARRLYPRMEISGDGLTLGAGTVLAGMAKDQRGRPRLAFDDEPRVMALLATAFERSVDVRLLAKLRRAAEVWTEGDKALAHIHLAHANLPRCNEELALRLFVADELIEAGVMPRTLMKAQGFDPAPLALLKVNFNPAQPRWPAGSGRDSGEWSGGASIDTAGIKEFIARLALEAARRAARALLRPSEPKPSNPEVVKPESKPPETPAAEQGISTPKPSDFVREDFGKLGVGIEKPDLSISRLSEHGEFRAETRGASVDDLESTVENPLLVLRQSSGRIFYLSDSAVVVLDPEGEVVTA